MEILENIRCFAVENPKIARRSIRNFGIETNFNECEFFDIHHKNRPGELSLAYGEIMDRLKNGKSVGILSDAGMAGIADPGNEIIALAHKNGIQVKPMVGPSSIILALAASGFSGQQFVFHGYLPIDERERKQSLKALEIEAKRSNFTQIFMETPYRNVQLFKTMLTYLHPETMLCIACNITSDKEMIQTKSMANWKKAKIDINKQPAIFLIGN